MPHPESTLLSFYVSVHLQSQLRLLQEAGEEVRQSYCWLARPLLADGFEPRVRESVSLMNLAIACVG